MRPGSKHSAATCERISRRVKAAMADPAVRQRVSERTKAAMAAPGVRQRIKAGMAKAYRADPDPDLTALQRAWDRASPESREKFLAGLLAGLLAGALRTGQ